MGVMSAVVIRIVTGRCGPAEDTEIINVTITGELQASLHSNPWDNLLGIQTCIVCPEVQEKKIK